MSDYTLYGQSRWCILSTMRCLRSKVVGFVWCAFISRWSYMLPTYLKDCTSHLQEFFLINAPLWQALRGCGTSRFTHLWYARRMVTVPIVFQLHCQLQDYCPESPSARCQCGLLQGGVSSLTCMAGLTSQLHTPERLTQANCHNWDDVDPNYAELNIPLEDDSDDE